MSNWSVLDAPHTFEIGLGGHIGGTGIVAGGAQYTKGSWTELSSALPFPVEMVHVRYFPLDPNNRFLLDIGSGFAGSELVRIPNIPRLPGKALDFRLPISFCAGQRLVARSSCETASLGGDCIITCATGNRGTIPGGSRVATNVTDVGTCWPGTVVDAGGTVNAKGAWTELFASTPFPFTRIAIQLECFYTGTSAGVQQVDIGTGAAGSEQPLFKDLLTITAQGTPQSTMGMMIFDADLPAGTRLSARAASWTTDADARKCFVGIWGIE